MSEDFQPKDGDIIVVHCVCAPVVVMFKQWANDDSKSFYYYAACSLGADSPFKSGVNYKGTDYFMDARPSTAEERGFFQRRLKMDGITYNGYHKLFKMSDTPEIGQTYYYLNSLFQVCEDTWGDGGSEQIYRFNAGNCFLNKLDAEDLQSEIQGTIRKMRKEKNKYDSRNKLL